VSTAGYVKLLLPPRQSRGNSHWGLGLLYPNHPTLPVHCSEKHPYSITSSARAGGNSGAHANCFAGHYSVDIGCPTMMLRGDRVGTTSVIANPALFKRSWKS
jgi:hypothetical protein